MFRLLWTAKQLIIPVYINVKNVTLNYTDSVGNIVFSGRRRDLYPHPRTPNLSLCATRPICHQVPTTTRRRLVAHTDSNDRPINFDTGPVQIRDGPSMRPFKFTRKRARSVSVPASDGYDPPRDDRQPNPRLTRPPTDRSLRPKTRSVTDREAAHRFDSDSGSLMKTKHFRKRRNIAPTETGIKRQKCAAIALGVHFTHTDNNCKVD